MSTKNQDIERIVAQNAAAHPDKSAPSADDLDAAAAEQAAKSATETIDWQTRAVKAEEELASLKSVPAKPEPTKEQLQALAASFKASVEAKGYKKMPQGGISLEVFIDEDMSEGLLSAAEQAGEHPGTYIRTQIGEALTAYWGTAQ